MTEGTEKRRGRRRGPRRKKADPGAAPPASGPERPAEGEAEGAGDAGFRSAAEPGPESGRSASGPAWSGHPARPGGSDDAEPEERAEVAGEAGGDEGSDLAGPAAAGEGAPKKGRRRGRRRGGRRHKGRADVPAGEPVAEGAPPSGAPDRPVEPEPGATPEPPVGAEDVEGPGDEGEPGAAPEGPEGPAGRRRRRRRRRSRRHRGGAPQPAGEEVAAPAEEPGEPAAPAEEAAREEVPEGRIAEEEEEGEAGAEEERGEAPGKGPRRTMVIDGAQPEEVRVAIVAGTQLEYFEAENQRKKQFKGNIYKGKVVNVAHAIEAAFVEFGGGRHGFLPLNEYCGGALMENLGSWNEGEKRPHLRPGMELLVQVTKEESTVKGAALTSYISIAGRYLVMALGMKRYGISKKITAEKDRERIRKLMEKLDYPEHLGFIVRTVGAGRSLRELKADMQNLLKLWDRTVEGARTNKAPSLLYEEQDIVVRTLRDQYSSDVAQVLIDSPGSFQKASDFFDVYYPMEKHKLVHYRQKRPVFSKFNLEEQIERMSARKVPLPSGGHIVIDRTEALWSIDVNSGRSSKDRDIEDTAFRTNREAALEATRQLRLRDMGGLIVIDFIDMEERSHNREIERILKEQMKKDKAKSDVSAVGKFGLVAISRQRMGISFYDVLMKPCDRCDGVGSIPTGDSIIVRLLRRIQDELSRQPGKEFVVRVSSLLLEKLLNQKREEITRLEKLCQARVTIVADPTLPAVSFSVEAAQA